MRKREAEETQRKGKSVGGRGSMMLEKALEHVGSYAIIVAEEIVMPTLADQKRRDKNVSYQGSKQGRRG